MKTMFKAVIILGVAGVATVAVAHWVLGSDRAHRAVHSLKNMAQAEVDELIQSQENLEAELAELRKGYPEQIALIRSQLREIDRQLEALEKETVRSATIITLCDEDLTELERQQAIVSGVATGGRVVVYRGSRYSTLEAEHLRARIDQTRDIYTLRIEGAAEERQVLEGEKDHLEGVLNQLRAEQQEFEAEYASLLREIERLKRSERFLELVESRSSLDGGYHGEAMTGLNAIKSKVEEARTNQQERIRAVSRTPRSLDYDTRARARERSMSRDAKRNTEVTPESGSDYNHKAEPEEVEEEYLLDRE